MRLIIAPFLLFSIAFSHAQTQPANVISLEDAAFNAAYYKAKIPVVTGKLLHITAEEIKKTSVTCSIVTPFASFQQMKDIAVMPDGSFTIPLDYALPYQQIWLTIGNVFYTCLVANTNLYVELDVKKLKLVTDAEYVGDGVSYLGDDGPLNTYYNSYLVYKRDEKSALINKITIISRPAKKVEDSTLQSYNLLFDSLKQIEDGFIASNPSPYTWILSNERMLDYYAGLCLIHLGHTINDTIWQKMNVLKVYTISNSSSSYYNNLAFYIASERLRQHQPVTWKDITGQVGITAVERAAIDSLELSEKMHGQPPFTPDNIKQWVRILNPRIQTLIFTKSLANNIAIADSLFLPSKADFYKLRLNSSKDINEQRVAWRQIAHSTHTAWCRDVANKEIEHNVAKMKEINKMLAGNAGSTALAGFGKPVISTIFNASLYKAPSLSALAFIKKLVESFPGKAIIIDRWATWCAPCIGEMPHSKELQAEAKGLPVVFVYVCTLSGSTEEKWKSKVAELQQPGVHILIDEDLDADLSDYFSFHGYPGYAFISKDGLYKPGAFNRITDIKDGKDLAVLVNN